uniref:Uncharacterized protein n=1 Tax=Zeugodacus cucurbitae TaxID=28588 RepID=A0A0A1WH25_ZEUCU
MQRGVLNVNSFTWNTQTTKTLICMLLICYTTTQTTNAHPVSIAEISGKTGKNIATTSSAATLLIKPSPQDAQLNSLNAYATNYGHFATQFANNAAPGGNTNANTDSSSSGSTNSQLNTSHFKASFKLPDIENNFTPLQTYNNGNNMPHAAPLTTIAATPNANTNNNLPQAKPVLMQYLPHALPETGVHYLQLIPTRPLILPISPSYLNGNAPSAVAQNAVNAAAHALHPPLAAAINAAPMDYGARAPPLLTPEPINSQQHTAPLANMLDLTNAAPPPYGVHTYANSLQPYRNSYRINREVKGKNFPGTMTLNMNEYIPGPNETLRPLYMRGRP